MSKILGNAHRHDSIYYMGILYVLQSAASIEVLESIMFSVNLWHECLVYVSNRCFRVSSVHDSMALGQVDSSSDLECHPAHWFTIFNPKVYIQLSSFRNFGTNTCFITLCLYVLYAIH